jgi:hypothetical protein
MTRNAIRHTSTSPTPGRLLTWRPTWRDAFDTAYAIEAAVRLSPFRHPPPRPGKLIVRRRHDQWAIYSTRQ